MTKETKADQEAQAASPEEIKDEALDEAEGGFALSGMFTKTLNTPVQGLTNFTAPDLGKINAPKVGLEDKTSLFVRKRPGRKSF
ncbi:MAG: hypothetical protein AAGI70_16415 [Pseudomonadota bacterium]